MATRHAPLAAFVLHHHDWSESSLILDLFTREQGRLVVAARGAKKPHSNFRAVLLPFQRLSVALGRGDAHAEVQTLRSAEFAGGPGLPRGEALFAGFYCNELLMKLLARHDAHPRLFDAYAATLPRLAGPDEAVQAALRAFELVLLRDIGLLPDLAHETSTQRPARPGAHYTLRGDAGLVESTDRGTPDGATWLALQSALDADASRADPAALAPLQAACARELPALRTQLRALLHYHLGTSALRSRQLLVDLQSLAA